MLLHEHIFRLCCDKGISNEANLAADSTPMWCYGAVLVEPWIKGWVASPEGPLLAHARSGRSIRAGHGSAEPSPAEQLTSQRKRKQGAIVEKAGATQKKQPVLARQRQNWLPAFTTFPVSAAAEFATGKIAEQALLDPSEVSDGDVKMTRDVDAGAR